MEPEIRDRAAFSGRRSAHVPSGTGRPGSRSGGRSRARRPGCRSGASPELNAATFGRFRASSFTVKGNGLIECWSDADARPEISPLHATIGCSVVAARCRVPITWARPGDPISRSVFSKHRSIAPTSIWSLSIATTTQRRTVCSGTTLSPPRVSSSPCAPTRITKDTPHYVVFRRA